MASTFRASRSMPVVSEAGAGELDGQRQADVAEADDADAGRCGWSSFCSEGLGGDGWRQTSMRVMVCN